VGADVGAKEVVGANDPELELHPTRNIATIAKAMTSLLRQPANGSVAITTPMKLSIRNYT